MAEFITGLEEISTPYKAVILDAWGVLHNGLKPYPYVNSALEKIRLAGKKILVLSNAPRRKESVVESLLKCGIEPSSYDYLHTSGEESYLTLRETNRYGKNCYHMGEIAHRGIFEDWPLNRVETMEDADFVLNTGFISPELKYESKDEDLHKAKELNLPMLCINPDYHVYVGDTLLLCAGAFAKRFEELGGIVHYFGKPYKNVYERALHFLKMSPLDVIAVGDSLATDIKGANAMGIQSVLALTGIHESELCPKGYFEPNKLAELSQHYGVIPNFVLPELKWTALTIVE